MKTQKPQKVEAHAAIEESIQYIGNLQHRESQDPHIGASTVKAHDKDPRAQDPEDHQEPWEPREVPLSRGHDTPSSDWKHKDLWRYLEARKTSSSSMRPQPRAQGGPPASSPGPPPGQQGDTGGHPHPPPGPPPQQGGPPAPPPGPPLQKGLLCQRLLQVLFPIPKVQM